MGTIKRLKNNEFYIKKSMPFPTDQEFEKNKISNNSKVLKWRDIPENTIFKIEKSETIKTKFGTAIILTLIDHDGTTYRCWATSVISDTLKCKKKDYSFKGKTLYIKSTGLKQSTTNPDNKYYDFDLMVN